jgi:UDP-2-acetamido-3-amino-2,3-dideoxy-glucuronate N-acetyltransferase
MTIEKTVACIGAGNWGRNIVRNIHALGTMSWICEQDRDLCERLRHEYPGAAITADLDQVLHDPATAGVTIATPAETHGAMVRRALHAGKHVFVEKPLCLSASEGKELVSLAQSKNLTLMVGHLLWYHPAILKLKQLVTDGDLGRIQYIYSNRLNLGKIRREENILWSFAPHDVSVILGLVGEIPDSVDAQGGYYLHDRIADVTVSLLSFPSGIKAHVFVSWLHPFKEQKLIVVGDRKMAVFDDLEDTEKLRLYPHSIQWKNHMPVLKKADAQVVNVDLCEPLREECLHFLECIRTGQTPRTDGQEGLRVLKVLETCQNALDKSNSRKVLTFKQPQQAYTIHPSSVVDENVQIGDGTTIWHFSHILKNCTIGDHCRIGQNVVIGPNVAIGDGVKIQNNVSVYEGVTLENGVFCGPSMVFTNVINPRSEIRRMEELRPTVVREGATLGANCTIVCGVRIGQYAFVGAGAVITRDVPDFALVVGNPGRLIGWMCKCGNRIRFDHQEPTGECVSCHSTYSKTDNVVSLRHAATGAATVARK